MAQVDLWGNLDPCLSSEAGLIASAFALCEGFGAPIDADFSDLWKHAGRPVIPRTAVIAKLAAEIAGGGDPLGEAFCSIRSPETRRIQGATYTPQKIVAAMADWAAQHKVPARIVDPGCGSARFLRAAAERYPKAQLVGIELDPLAALVSRANLAASGLWARSRILLADFRSFRDEVQGPTLYIGNPPYVRHHNIGTPWKSWLTEHATRLALPSSQLAGLHVHFYLATAMQAKEGDFGVYITAAEWLDVNYGALVRHLLTQYLGGRSLSVIEPTAQPFPDAAATAAVATFEVGSEPSSLSFRRISNVSELPGLEQGRFVHRDRLIASSRWSYLTHAIQKAPEGFIELGELCRVHRGQVTGANSIWIAGDHSIGLPSSVLYRTITRAREVIAANGQLDDASRLKCVIDIPVDLDSLDAADRTAVERFLKKARSMGANRGYVAEHRRAWWSVGLRSPAPILSTYMARRAPAFMLNTARARHINIAHGLYPRLHFPERVLDGLTRYLRTNVSRQAGRTYAGGLTKFEPREMERLLVPSPELLVNGAYA